MIDITRAQANQTTRNGINEDWVVTLEGEKIYTLPANFSPEDTFMIRDIIEKMMKMAVAEEHETQEQRLSDIVEVGDGKLDFLKAENVRLATALQREILTN
jgi:hypothetical protein